VPDQFTADFFHTSTAEPPYPSPQDPGVLATRAEMAALALSALARAGALHDVPMLSLAANLQLASPPYPAVADAKVSIFFSAASENFTAVRSPQVDSWQAALLAFAEATASELDVALQALPELPDAINVRNSVVCACFFIVGSLLP
jgi:hypothetical protein